MLARADLTLEDGDHVVRFYDDDNDLIDVVGGYLAAALSGGDSVVILATPSHTAAFAAALTTVGLDMTDPEVEGRVTVLDAQEALDGFMIDDWPDARRFESVVGDLVRRQAATGRPVRAYGEMVAVLCADGNRPGAIELERLWNELGNSVPFALFCAYPTDTVVEGVDTICGLHSQVVPISEGASRSCSFNGTPQDLRRARRFLCEVLRSWGAADAMDDAAVVLSELATNAVMHAKSGFTVSVTRTRSGVRVSVADRSAVAPVVRHRGTDATGGRGLHLVKELATQWGHEFTDTGKVVWAEL